MSSLAIPFPERYRLVVLDVDGTLLDSNHELPERVAVSIRATQRHGIGVALATGKMLIAVHPLIEAMDLHGPQITLNGAAVVLADTGEPAVFTPLRQRDRRRVIETIRRVAPDVLVTHFTLDRILLDQPNHPMIDVLLAYGESEIAHVPSLLADDVPPAAKILLAAPRDRLAEVRSIVTPVLQSDVTITTTAPDFLEFFDPGAGKGRGLAALLDMLNLPHEAVIAIGDGENDMPLFAEAGLAVAMGNAPANVRAAAHMTIGSNDDAGVAIFLDELMMARLPDEAD